MIDRGFWDNLDKPIIGLAPMDGVTDAAFRNMVCKYSKPAVVITEFTNVEGLARGSVEMLKAFIYNETQRPIVAQIYGTEVDSFYKATVMLCAMGFDGVDINMGCPAKKVERKGAGAGLIQTPALAKEIVEACKKAATDWANGINMEKAGVHPDIIAAVDLMKKNGLFGTCIDPVRRNLPISVKTRTGYNKIVTEDWINHLIDCGISNISLHGRTLKQGYGGEADWEQIGKAAILCRKAGIGILGNGDVRSMEQALKYCEQYCVDGILIGRAVMGAPWFFGGEEPDISGRLRILLQHARYFTEMDYASFHNIKKHLAWYCKGFEGAGEVRMRLMQTDSLEEVEAIVGHHL